MSRILEQLKSLGFSAMEREPQSLVSDTPYQIRVKYNPAQPAKSKVDFGAEMTVHHSGICSIGKAENLVVLECVLRLLRKGYPANRLELKKTWKLGHRGKGRLDILIRSSDGKTFAMIECKAWGQEYAGERDNILEDGGQLFRYFTQDRDATFLILYTADVAREIRNKAEAVDTRGLTGSNLDQLFRSWDRSFLLGSIFDESASPYSSERTTLIKSELLDLDKSSGRGLFNSFAEILRRNVISDKSNAFNKIFNLFVCKIYDEDTAADDNELAFQWKPADTVESLLARLTSLYLKGLEQYLNVRASGEFFNVVSEFSFIDVYDKESFDRNGQILREIVQVLQTYCLKYSGKHQFLGDFFEQLLTTGIKQESGQYFTPVPLARFIIKSLPLDELIRKKIEARETQILPYTIDFACGSGHFLTEAIEEIEEHQARIDPATLTGRAKSFFTSSRQDYQWAREYVYGIEKDYRLAKTTKVATFLNGDGDATILNCDGLDDFYTSPAYIGKLKAQADTRTNCVFDALVSNPPFSIPGFKRYVANGEKNFSLYKYLTARSSEIECLFLERATQLLRSGGVAGIILPLSILNSELQVYSEARKRLLVECQVCGCVELREKTFIATPTTTVVLFLRKRSDEQIRSALVEIRRHYLDREPQESIKEIIEQSAISRDEEGLIEALNSLPATWATRSNGSMAFDTTLLKSDLAYLLIAVLNAETKMAVGFSGEKNEQENFLGYRFSTSRGKEGLHPITQDGVFAGQVFDPSNLDNPLKINAHIRAAFKGEALDIPPELAGHIDYINAIDFVQSKNFVMHNPSSYLVTQNVTITSISPLGDFIDRYDNEPIDLAALVESGEVQITPGLVYKDVDESAQRTAIRVLTASNIDLERASLDLSKKMIHLRSDFPVRADLQPRKSDIVVSTASGSLRHLGKAHFVTEDMDAMIGGFLTLVRCRDEKLAKAVYYRILSLPFRRHVAALKDQNINNLGDIRKFQFTIPRDLDEFFAEAARCEIKLRNATEAIESLRRVT